MARGISSLFPELLSECFVHIRDITVEADPESPYSWLSLMLVCKHWHNIALGRPPLWSYIDLSICPPNIVDQLLRRSGASPLTVKLIDLHADFPTASSDVVGEANIMTVLHHVHRIRDLELSISQSTIHTLKQRYPSALRAPILQSLNLGNASSLDTDYGRGSLPFHFDSPKLTALTLCHFGYHHMSALFHPRLRCPPG